MRTSVRKLVYRTQNLCIAIGNHGIANTGNELESLHQELSFSLFDYRRAEDENFRTLCDLYDITHDLLLVKHDHRAIMKIINNVIK